MKIADSNVRLASQSSYARRVSVNENLVLWDNRSHSPLSTEENIQVDISDSGKAMLEGQAVRKAEDTEENVLELPEKEKEKIRLIEDFIYVLTGKRIRLLVPKRITKGQLIKIQELQDRQAGQGTPRQVGWGMDYTWERRVKEQERMNFSSSGTVTTEDGRIINFSLNFSVSREFMSYERSAYRPETSFLTPGYQFPQQYRESWGPQLLIRHRYGRQTEEIAFTAEGSGFRMGQEWKRSYR